jgi:hypothetical protein
VLSSSGSSSSWFGCLILQMCVCYKVNFIWSNSAEHGTPSGRNVRHRGVAKRTSCSAFPIISGDLEKRHVSAADVASITINPNSTVVVWVETSGNSRFGNKMGFDVVTALRLDDGGVVLRFLPNVLTGSETHPAPYRMGTRTLS